MTRREQTRGCSAISKLVRRLAGIVQARNKAGRAVTVTPELWQGLETSERTFWRAANMLPPWIERQRVYDHGGSRWKTLLLYVPKRQKAAQKRPQRGQRHHTALPLRPLEVLPWVAAVGAALGAWGNTPKPVAVQRGAAGVARLAAAGPDPGRMGAEIWTTACDGAQRMPGQAAWRLALMAAALGVPTPGVLEGATEAQNPMEGTNQPECQHHIRGGLVLENQTEMETPGGGARSPTGVVQSGPVGPKVPADGGATNIKLRHGWERRRAWAVAAREIRVASGRSAWSRPLVASWVAKMWHVVPEGRLKCALARGLTWAWGGYQLAKAEKSRPDPPSTLAALAHAERLLGIRD